MKREVIDWKVRPSRRKLALSGSVTGSDGSQFRVLLSDISYEGCNMLSEGHLSAGEVIQVTIPGMGRMEAQVRWVDGDKVGVRFLLGQSSVEDRRARIGV